MRTLPTFEELKEMGSSCLLGSYFKSVMGEVPIQPIQPKLKGETPELLRQYANEMERYLVLHENWIESLNDWRKKRFNFEELLDRYVKDISGFNDVPDEYKDGLWHHASKGIEGDHYEIYCKLQEICSEVFGC